MLDESGVEVVDMPMPYSHTVLADRIATGAGLPIKDEAQYYVGAFYPDIRYFTKQPREKYHFTIDKLKPFEFSSDVSNDFLLGYKVHLLIDEVWEYPELKETYKQAFPSFIRSRMTRGLQALALEMYCLEQKIEPIKLKPVDSSLTRSLDVQPFQTQVAVDAMQKYIDQHSLESAYVMAEKAQLFPAERLKTVRQVLGLLDNPLTSAIAMGAVRGASRRIFPLVLNRVKERLEASNKIPDFT
jgi:hypothetical protein